MAKRFIGFRLRKEYDDDIADAIKHLDQQSVSELARTGLRLALGIKSQKVIQVVERPVSMPKLYIPGRNPK